MSFLQGLGIFLSAISPLLIIGLVFGGFLLMAEYEKKHLGDLNR